MTKSIVRTDRWSLNPNLEAMVQPEGAVSQYRQYCKALSYVVMANWEAISSSESQCSAVEKLIHKTAKNPNPKHSYFGKRFYKFPSYLRRAAIEFVCGQVSSFQTRYREWQSGTRKKRDAKPPHFNPESGCYPTLYRGQCVKFDEQFSAAQVKVWNGSDWVWTTVQIIGLRQRHLLDHSRGLSPSLIVRDGKASPSVPFRLYPQKLLGDLVCAVDVGINTTATASIVSPDGTVMARRFFHRGRDIDRRDKVLQQIRAKATLTGKLSKGFCRGLYRRAHGLNHNMAQHVSKAIVQFSLEYGASVIVFEDLNSWKPKGGRKRSTLK